MLDAEAIATYSATVADKYVWSFSGPGSFLNGNTLQNLDFKAPKMPGNYLLQVSSSNTICPAYYVIDSKTITVNNTPPTPPTNFTATRVSSGAHQLTWGASQDNLGVSYYV